MVKKNLPDMWVKIARIYFYCSMIRSTMKCTMLNLKKIFPCHLILNIKSKDWSKENIRLWKFFYFFIFLYELR